MAGIESLVSTQVYWKSPAPMRLRPLFLLFLLALMVGIGGFAFYLALTKQVRNSPGTVDVTIGSTKMRLRSAYMRFALGREGGHVNRLDIAATFPALEPAGTQRLAAPATPTSEPDKDIRILFLTITQADRSIDPADRPTSLYSRFLEADVWTHDAGLLMRRFKNGSPYAREDLYLAPPDGRLFAARCMRPSQPPDGLPDTCLYDFRTQDLDVQVRFSPTLLGEWSGLAENTKKLVDKMIRP